MLQTARNIGIGINIFIALSLRQVICTRNIRFDTRIYTRCSISNIPIILTIAVSIHLLLFVHVIIS